MSLLHHFLAHDHLRLFLLEQLVLLLLHVHSLPLLHFLVERSLKLLRVVLVTRCRANASLVRGVLFSLVLVQGRLVHLLLDHVQQVLQRVLDAVRGGGRLRGRLVLGLGHEDVRDFRELFNQLVLTGLLGLIVVVTYLVPLYL